MFRVQAILPRSESPQIWAARLIDCLSSSEASRGFSLDECDSPLAGSRYIIMRWGEWTMTVHPAASSESPALSVVFGTDPNLEFANHIIWVQDFLQSIPGVLYRENV